MIENQDEKRATRPAQLIEALSRGLRPGETLGHIRLLHAHVKGGRTDMQNAYSNAMTMIRELGKFHL